MEGTPTVDLLFDDAARLLVKHTARVVVALDRAILRCRLNDESKVCDACACGLDAMERAMLAVFHFLASERPPLELLTALVKGGHVQRLTHELMAALNRCPDWTCKDCVVGWGVLEEMAVCGDRLAEMLRARN